VAERERKAGSDWPLLALLAGAYGGFASAFLGPRDRFFVRMTRHGAALGAVALSSEPALRRLRPTVPALIQGGAIAAALYGMFRVGDPIVRRVLPRGGEQIEDLYGLRTGHQALGVAARLVLVIGPSEELFWRGLVQRRLSALLGREDWGALAGTAAYAGAHLATRNPALVAAAAVAGGWWGGLAARGVPMEALITSHALWDVLVFLVAPTSGQRPEPV
jgi:membrane protease YdiL (CAAX protease family)